MPADFIKQSFLQLRWNRSHVLKMTAKAFFLTLIFLAVVHHASVWAAPAPQQVLAAQLDDEEGGGGILDWLFFMPENIYKAIPKSQGVKDWFSKAYNVVLKIPLLGQLVDGRDAVREVIKDVDHKIIPTTTTARPTTTFMLDFELDAHSNYTLPQFP
jgi:hypothetical protein